MDSPTLPHSTPLVWRSLTTADAAALRQLDAACKQADGFEPVSDLPSAALNAPGTLAAFDRDTLAAVGWISDPSGEMVVLGGNVHPAYRRQGLGSRLLAWSLSATASTPRAVIRCEALTPGAEVLYTRYGFMQVFAERMLVRPLTANLPAAAFPPDLQALTWQADTAPDFLRVYQQAFADRPGFDPAWIDDWIEENESDETFLPDFSHVLLNREQPVAFVTCGYFADLAWIMQIGVIPAFRGQGLTQTLLAAALRQFAAAGYREIGLHVNVNNPFAERAFTRAGFRQRLVRARYQRDLAVQGPQS